MEKALLKNIELVNLAKDEQKKIKEEVEKLEQELKVNTDNYKTTETELKYLSKT